MGGLSPEEEFERWLRQAEADLRSARNCLRAEEFSTCSFLCQQAAEKALKSLLYGRGLKIFGHSLVSLFGRLENIGFPSATPEEAKAAERLDKHYTTTRYPDALSFEIPDDFYTETIALEALEWADQLLQYVYANRP